MDKYLDSDLAVPLVLPVVHPTYAYYVLAGTAPPGNPWDGLDEHLVAVTPDDLQDLVSRMADEVTDLQVLPARRPPSTFWEVALCAGADPAEVRQARRAKHHLVVRSRGRVGEPIEHWWTALAVARALRRRTGGVLLDVVVNRVLPAHPDSGAVDALASAGRDALTPWTWVQYSAQTGGYWMTVAGLERFGLPALSLERVRAERLQQSHHLLMGLAGLLVDHQAKEVAALLDPPALREVPRGWTVTAADVARAYPVGQPPRQLLPETAVTLHETANDALGGVAMLEVRRVGRQVGW